MAELDYDYLARLVKKTQSGDSDAFAELYAATYQKQYGFTYRYVKDSYLAQDILQEVYILVLKNIQYLKNPRLFVSWLNQINFRICFDTCQKSSRHKQELNHVYELNDPERKNNISSSDPERQTLKQEEKTEIMSHILSLHPHEAQAIIMRYYNDMSLEEIADAMDCSRSTVKRRIQKGCRHLEVLLGDEKGGVLFG